MKKEDWLQAKWRPAMGWMYMVVCIFDFMIAPVLWSILQSITNGNVTSQWQPLTLQGAGLFHLAMGAVLGIAAFGRTQEKLSGANNGGLPNTNNFNSAFMPSLTPQQSCSDVESSEYAAPPYENPTAPTKFYTRPKSNNGVRSPMPYEDPEI